jgi:probable HAF family extracellular repeat protein
MIDLGTLGGVQSEARGINDAGEVVGGSYIAAGGPDHAFLYTGGQMLDLNSLISTNSGWTLFYASGINDAGQIVGQGLNSSGTFDAYLLTPIPECPAGLIFAAGGAWMLLFRFRAERRAG